MSLRPKKYGSAIPVRFEDGQTQQINELSEKTNLSRNEIVRRACTAMLPKFLSGEVLVVDVNFEAQPSTAEAGS